MKKILGFLFVIVILGCGGYFVYVNYIKSKVPNESPYGKKIDYMTDKGCRFYNLEIDRRGTNILNDIKLIISYYKLLKKEKPDWETGFIPD